jgi:oligoendopeptidase F
MSTIEKTGADEVAWDLSDLYAGADDPTLERDVLEAEQAATAFRERYHGKVSSLTPAELADAVAEHERIESIFTRAGTYAHLNFATNMADASRGALVAKLDERGAALDTQLLFFGLEWAALEDEQADALLEAPAIDPWRHHLRSQRVFRPSCGCSARSRPRSSPMAARSCRRESRTSCSASSASLPARWRTCICRGSTPRRCER